MGKAKMNLVRPQSPHLKGLPDGANTAGSSVTVYASKQGRKKSGYAWGSIEGNKEGGKLSDLDKCVSEARMHGTV